MRIIRIKTTALMLVGFFLGLLALSSLAALWNQKRMISASSRITTNSLPVIYGVGRALSTVKDIRGKMRAHIVSESASEKAQGQRELEALAARLDAEFNSMEQYLNESDAHSRWVASRSRCQTFVEIWKSKVLPISQAEGQKKEAMAAFLDQGMAAFKSANEALESLNQFQKVGVDADAANAQAISRQSALFTWIFLAVAAVGGGLLSAWLISTLLQNLNGALARLQTASIQLDTLAEGLSGSSRMLSDGACQQMASIEETSAVAVELLGTSTKNSSTTQAASEQMRTLVKQLHGADDAVSSAGGSMTVTRGLTKKMAHIVKAIDEIAFQTNILALNAAVEAARAGESGQGFAVVADEVRALAMRSAQAAKETSELISDAGKSTEAGAANTERAVRSFQELHSIAGSYTGMVEEILAASDEQARAVHSMSDALHHIENLTQKTAAEASHTSTSAESLQSEAVSLRKVVDTLSALA